MEVLVYWKIFMLKYLGTSALSPTTCFLVVQLQHKCIHRKRKWEAEEKARIAKMLTKVASRSRNIYMSQSLNMCAWTFKIKSWRKKPLFIKPPNNSTGGNCFLLRLPAVFPGSFSKKWVNTDHEHLSVL